MGTLPFYTHQFPLPNAFAQINSLARTPFNQLGAGALIGVREFETLCFCGTGITVSAGLTGQNAQDFATESYQFPFTGLRCIASGIRQEEWWYTDQPGPGPIAGRLLFRIRQVAAHGSQGNLITAVNPNQVAFHIYGPPSGGDPFLLGAVSAILPVDVTLFAPPFGIIELNPFHPLYVPLLDGVGLFGPPNPFAVIPGGGHFQMSISLPPGGSGLAFRIQALILSPNVAPNGLFFISNVELLTLP
jgi:hypothetical protein